MAALSDPNVRKRRINRHRTRLASMGIDPASWTTRTPPAVASTGDPIRDGVTLRMRAFAFALTGVFGGAYSRARKAYRAAAIVWGIRAKLAAKGEHLSLGRLARLIEADPRLQGGADHRSRARVLLGHLARLEEPGAIWNAQVLACNPFPVTGAERTLIAGAELERKRRQRNEARRFRFRRVADPTPAPADPEDD